MEIIRRKRTIQILILLACCIIIALWINSKWNLIDLAKEKQEQFEHFEDDIAPVDSSINNDGIDTDTVVNDNNTDTTTIIDPDTIVATKDTIVINDSNEGEIHIDIILNSREENVVLLIEEALKHIDVREKTGNNDGHWVKLFLNITGLGEGYPWCAAYVSFVHHHAGISAPRSARVVDWFKNNVVWKKEYGDIPEEFNTEGMVGGLFYEHLGRLGHIFIIIGEDKNNFYTIEGNTNMGGSREGDGVYKKIRSKSLIATLGDYTVNKEFFEYLYGEYLEEVQ
ncbi:MAG: hypothetical protein ACOCVF_00280 [bacterium]